MRSSVPNKKAGATTTTELKGSPRNSAAGNASGRRYTNTRK